MEKTCKFCKKTKPLEQFVKIRTFVRKCCLTCYQSSGLEEQRERDIEFLENRRNYENVYKKQYRQKHWASALYKQAKQRAKVKGLSFEIEISDIIIPEFCPILGIKLQQGQSRMIDASPSLDRIKPELGYIKNNIKVISNRANRIKSNGTIEEHQKIIKYLIENS
jgi:hypothetical protein